MKIFIPFILFAIIASCKTSKQTSASLMEFEKNATTAAVEDSVLQSLQKQYDIVLASATENYAWVRNVNYTLLCKKGTQWTGYTYYKNNMPPGDKKNYIPFTLTSATVDKEACDSLLNFMLANKVWNIKGDADKGFCQNGKKDCVINDAATKRLWVITTTKFIAPSYYAPDFYENCCPGDEERKLFLSVTDTIESMVTIKGAEQ